MLIVCVLLTPPLFIANEAFRGLAKCQAVLREGSAVPCTTESWVPVGRGRSKRSAEQKHTADLNHYALRLGKRS